LITLYIALWILAGLLAAVAYHWVERHTTPSIQWGMVAILVTCGPVSILATLIVFLFEISDRGNCGRNPFYRRTP
jgi:hypothetical protein